MKATRLVPLVLVAATLAAVCDDSSRRPVGALPKRGASDDTNSVARKVGEIQDLHAPESVKYDSAQDVFFISNIQGIGSNKDGRGFIARTPASNYGAVTIFAQSGKGGIELHAPKGMAIQGDTLWV